MSRYLEFTVTGQQIVSTNTIEDIIENSAGYLIALFTFSDIWDALLKIVIFTGNSKNYALVIPDNGEIEIPKEVIKNSSFSVGCYGKSDAITLTTNTVQIPVEESVRTYFGGNKEYLELYKELSNKVDDYYKNIETAEKKHIKEVQKIINEHVVNSAVSDFGAHNIRVKNGSIQYNTGGVWANTDINSNDSDFFYMLNESIPAFFGLCSGVGTHEIRIGADIGRISDRSYIKVSCKNGVGYYRFDVKNVQWPVFVPIFNELDGISLTFGSGVEYAGVSIFVNSEIDGEIIIDKMLPAAKYEMYEDSETVIGRLFSKTLYRKTYRFGMPVGTIIGDRIEVSCADLGIKDLIRVYTFVVEDLTTIADEYVSEQKASEYVDVGVKLLYGVASMVKLIVKTNDLKTTGGMAYVTLEYTKDE